METIAVYREERIKIYGITERIGLALGILRIPADRMEQWGRHVADLEGCTRRFELVTCDGAGQEMEMHLLFAQNLAEMVRSAILPWLAKDQDADFRLFRPVDLLYLHGPHFQDRFGIADIAFAALAKGGFDILVSGCAGTSMYLVLPANQGAEGVTTLRQTFLIPTSI